MNRTAPAALLAAAALALTGCQTPAPTETTAQVACEDLVGDRLRAPDSAQYEHRRTVQDGDRWEVRGIVRADNAFGGKAAEQYVCHVQFHDDADYSGTVAFVTP